jgi:hypothetical protein
MFSLLLSTVFSAFFLSGIQALKGCDPPTCSSPDAGYTNCGVGNATLTQIGIDNLTLPIGPGNSPATLTWTLGEQSFNSDHDAQLDQYFYLGSPPGLDLNQSQYGGCALFFREAAADLAFVHGVVPLEGNGTCAAAMGSTCVEALLSQGQAAMHSILTSGNNSIGCEVLARMMQNSTPTACAVAAPKGSWGQIISSSKSATAQRT